MKLLNVQIQRTIFLFLTGLISVAVTQAQIWNAPVLSGSTLTTGTTYYMYNVGSNGYLNRGGYWTTQAVLSALSLANQSTTIIKWTARNSAGSTWTFQYNSGGADVSNNYLFAANASAADGSVYTDNSGNNTWDVLLTDAAHNIYSIQIVNTYGGYMSNQYLGSSSSTENTNKGIANTVRYNRVSGDGYTQWKFVSQADAELYTARMLLDRYMNYAKLKGGIDLTLYIATYNAGVTADINAAAENLLSDLGRIDVTSYITNPGFEHATFTTGWTNVGFVRNNSNPMIGWTKEGTYFVEKWATSGSNLAAGTITQTLSGLSDGLYGLVLSGQAYQQAGANPLHTGAFATAGNLSAEVVAGKDYSVDFIQVSGGTLSIGYKLEAPVACNWTAFDNFRLYCYAAYPTIFTSSSTLNKLDEYNTRTFTVSGNHLQGDISILAPEGFSVSPTTLTPSSGIVAATTVTVTYTGTGEAGWSNITLSSTNATSKTVKVRATHNNACFSPTYSDKTNLITDTYISNLANYTLSWGAGATTDTTVVYCGLKSGKVTGTRAGSITYNLSGIWKPNTKYRLKARIYTPTAGRFDFWVSGWSGSSAEIGASLSSSEISYTSNVSGLVAGAIASDQWNDVDFTFTTGILTAVNQYFYFNNFIANTSGTSYIDNIELYEIERYVSSTSNITDITSSNTTNAELRINSGGQLTINTSSSLKSIIAAPDAKLTLSESAGLTVTNLSLLSDATGTGTFVNNNEAGSAITGSVQQYLTSGRNWYISSPVNAATASALSTATSVVKYNEPTASWVTLTAGDLLTAGRGYISSSTTTSSAITFNGILNDGEKQVTLSRTYGVNKAGFNLVGNPYPSYLSWDNVEMSTNVQATVWYRTKNNIINPETGNTSYVFDTYNSAGQIGTSLNGEAVNGNIPPMQAFWVRVNPPVLAHDTTGIIIFRNSMRVHKTGADLRMKMPRLKNISQQVLRLQVSNGVNSDEAIVLFNPNASNAYDAYDSPKMSNANAALPEIYTVVDNQQLVINGINVLTDGMQIPLGFNTLAEDSFIIKSTQFSDFDNARVILRDNEQNIETDITDGTAYNFRSSVANTTSRFSLIFRTSSLTTVVNNHQEIPSVLIYHNGAGQIVVNSSKELSGNNSATVYNSFGQVQESLQLNGSKTMCTKVYTPGVYIVSAVINSTNMVFKVIIN